MENSEMNEKEESFFRKKIIGSFTYAHVIGILLGVIGGFLYYTYVGCASGTCAITSNPWISTLWGAALGYLISDMFVKPKKKV